MPVNPQLVPSFRFPNNISSSEVHPEVVKAIRSSFRAFTDLYQAIPQLSSRIGALEGGAQSTANPISTSLADSINAANAAPSTSSGAGGVNNQSTSTTYATRPSDNGTLVTLNASSPVAFTLNSGVSVPFLVFVANYGAGTATLTPSSGTVNGASNVTLPTNYFGAFYFDGTNWYGLITAPASSTGTYLKGSVTITIGTQASATYFTATATITGATTSMAATATAPTSASFSLIQLAQIVYTASVTAANTVTVAVWVPGGGVNYGTITIPIIVFP